RQAAVFKAAWIYVGPHNDGGWSQAHDEGRLAVQKALGSKVQTTYKENVPEGPQVCQTIESLIRDGNKIIFATSFGFQTCMAQEGAAQSLPCAGADGRGQNVDSPSTGQYAESVGIPWVGYDSDAQKFAPKSWLTAAIYNWGVYYVPRVKAAMNGTWKTGFYYG